MLSMSGTQERNAAGRAKKTVVARRHDRFDFRFAQTLINQATPKIDPKSSGSGADSTEAFAFLSLSFGRSSSSDT